MRGLHRTEFKTARDIEAARLLQRAREWTAACRRLVTVDTGTPNSRLVDVQRNQLRYVEDTPAFDPRPSTFNQPPDTVGDLTFSSDGRILIDSARAPGKAVGCLPGEVITMDTLTRYEHQFLRELKSAGLVPHSVFSDFHPGQPGYIHHVERDGYVYVPGGWSKQRMYELISQRRTCTPYRADTAVPRRVSADRRMITSDPAINQRRSDFIRDLSKFPESVSELESQLKRTKAGRKRDRSVSFAAGHMAHSVPEWFLAKWMSNPTYNNKKLRELVIPGTHDSTTYGISSDSVVAPGQDLSDSVNMVPEFLRGALITKWAVAQNLTTLEQLNAGVRYLDIRIINRDEPVTKANPVGQTFWTLHSLYSLRFEDVLRDISDFHRANPTEIVIVDLNHFYRMNTSNTPTKRTKSELVLAAFKRLHHLIGRYLRGSIADSNLTPNSTLSEFRSRGTPIVVIYNSRTADMIRTQSHVSLEPSWSTHSIVSPWPNVQHVSLVEKHLAALSASPSVTENGKLVVFQCQISPDTSFITSHVWSGVGLKYAADRDNPMTSAWIDKTLVEKKQFLNILIFDFMTPALASKIISWNERY
jgi:hypothetical protein